MKNNPFTLLLTVFFLMIGQTAVAQELIPLILFDGVVLNDSGQPVSGAEVQFWQTDLDGYYDHPSAPDTDLRDPSFQFYGTATTAADGSFSFKTYRPGLYPGRPGHIHFKVWFDGTELLTSQFYFADENANQPDSLTLDLVEGTNEDGTVATLTSKTIVVNMSGDGSQAITPAQQEGPFYPVVDFFGLDTDLTVLDMSSGTPTAVHTKNSLITTSNLLILGAAVIIITVGLYRYGQRANR